MISDKMGDLFGNYEHHFSNLSSEITAKICKVPNLHGDEKKQAVGEVERLFDEIREVLEQMDLEVREMSGESRVKMASRVKTYKGEVTKLEQDLKKAKIAFSDDARGELFGGDDSHHSEDQRTRLLDNTERLERSSRRLEEGYRMCVETEEIGVNIMDNLDRDKEVINRARERLRGTDSNLSKSSRVLTGMMRRVIQNRIILVLVCLSILVVIGLVIYYSVKK